MSCGSCKWLLCCVIVNWHYIEAGSQYSPEEKLNISSETGVEMLNVGQKQSLVCRSTEPGMQWVDPSGGVVGASETSRVHVVQETDKLILIFNEPKLADNGTWTCQARDMLRTVDVFVVEEVQFQEHNRVVSPALGADQTFTCTARGVPKPRLTWYRDGVIMTAMTSPTKYDVWEGRLVIRNVRRDDSGNYECTAHQEISVPNTDTGISNLTCKWNYTASVVATLKVQHGPIMNYGVKQIIYVLYDHIRTIRCSASAFPKPSYRWSHRTPRGEKFIPLYSGDIYTHKNGSFSDLTIRVNGQDDLGDYFCYAKNIHGINSTIFHLVKGRQPSRPDKVEHLSRTSDSLIFTVDCDKCMPLTNNSYFSPANLPEVGFRFELIQQDYVGEHKEPDPVYWERDRDQILLVDLPRRPDNNTLSVSGLSPKTTYRVRVASRNQAGLSDFLEFEKQLTTKSKASTRTPYILMTIISTAAMMYILYH